MGREADSGILAGMDIHEISQYLDGLLEIHSIRDYPKALNGLQVENKATVRKIGLAVDACLATINMAKDAGCQMMFVHHGLFWGGLQPVRGPHYQKLAALMAADTGAAAVFVPGQPERTELLRQASMRMAGAPASTLPQVQPASSSGLPTFSISE